MLSISDAWRNHSLRERNLRCLGEQEKAFYKIPFLSRHDFQKAEHLEHAVHVTDMTFPIAKKKCTFIIGNLIPLSLEFSGVGSDEDVGAKTAHIVLKFGFLSGTWSGV